MKLATRRMECTRCGQWSSYGTSCIGPCSGSTFTGHGHRDPLHTWRTILVLRVIQEKRRASFSLKDATMTSEADSDEVLEWRRVPSPKPMTRASIMVAGAVRRWGDGYWETGTKDAVSRVRGGVHDGYSLPVLSGDRTVSLGPPTPDTRVTVRRGGAPGNIFTVLTPDGPTEVRAGETLTFEAVKRRRPPLRVFRFRDEAWQCPKDAPSCYVEVEVGSSIDRTGVVISGYEANVARGDEPRPVLDVIWRNKAARLSTWGEWFDLTMRKAAHDYLDAAIDAHRAYGDSESGDCPVPHVALEAAVSEIVAERGMRVYNLMDFGADAYGTPLYDYLLRVKADIESRLAGNLGEVQKPQETP